MAAPGTHQKSTVSSQVLTEARRPRKVHSAWMADFKLKGGPRLGQLLAREYHQSSGQFRSW